MQSPRTLLGPFSQLLTLSGLPPRGPIGDDRLTVIKNAGILTNGALIEAVGDYQKLKAAAGKIALQEVAGETVALPGFIDAHTHICFAGSRAADYSERLRGTSYLGIARKGGGIMHTVRATRAAGSDELIRTLKQRCDRHLEDGVTTCEVKSGYGLTVTDELKMLSAIHDVNEAHAIDLIPTCLAAHVCPPEFKNPTEYIDYVVAELLPEVRGRSLAGRADIFVEETAFGKADAGKYLAACRALGFSLTVHADQFSVLGSRLAAEYGAVSADHLEACDEAAMERLAAADVMATVLPGASLGLGMPFAPARKLLDHSLCLVIASDWNPGSAPMGDLLMQAAVLGAAQKLTTTETLAGITSRAARALELTDRGELAAGKLADLIAFPCSDCREVLYHQGKMKPAAVWKGAERVNRQNTAPR